MDKKKLLILGVAGVGLYFLMQNTGETQEQQTISGGGGGYSASIEPQEPAGLGSAQPTIVYATNLEAPVFPTGETASGTTTSKKVSTSGGTPVKTGTPVYNPATKTYTFFEGTPKSVQDKIISTTERQIASAPANNPVIVDYVKKQTQQPAQPTYNWAQRTAGQAYTGWSRITNKVRGWF